MVDYKIRRTIKGVDVVKVSANNKKEALNFALEVQIDSGKLEQIKIVDTFIKVAQTTKAVSTEEQKQKENLGQLSLT